MQEGLEAREATQGSRSAGPRRPSRGLRPARVRENLSAYMFIAPFMIIFGVFLAYPVFYSLYLALHRVPTDSFDVFGSLRFVGLANFQLLFSDVKFWWSVLMTLYYAALIIPAGIAVSLTLALLLNNRLKAVAFYRSAFFMPYVLDMLVIGIVWTLIYSPHVGILVRILESVGITAFSERGFLGMPSTAMPAVVLTNVLKGAGFGMILYLSAIQNIPQSLYEAASIDGASGWQRFRSITLPLVKPITFFMVIIGTISALNAFVEVYAMTGGGPNVDVGGRALGATWVTGYYVFDTFYNQFRLGYAASMSYVLLALTLVVTFVNRHFLGAEEER
ncbi:MAG: ABC transporter permease subunit [Candidatus Eisenbacteria bacterium]|nr:ABC transporter permease subunit [Candidatus Eisenbacteria bacterium]